MLFDHLKATEYDNETRHDTVKEYFVNCISSFYCLVECDCGILEDIISRSSNNLMIYILMHTISCLDSFIRMETDFHLIDRFRRCANEVIQLPDFISSNLLTCGGPSEVCIQEEHVVFKTSVLPFFQMRSEDSIFSGQVSKLLESLYSTKNIKVTIRNCPITQLV
jgi:hypothetical protein